MSRNGSGTYSLPSTIANGDDADADILMGDLSDLGAEITNSLALDGQSSMTAPLKGSNGSVTAPSYTFGSDTNTGFYRIGADNFGAACAGAKVLDVGTGGMDVTGDLGISGALTAGMGTMPVGAIMDYAGSSAPTGWLLFYGQSLLRASYADLFTAIGTTYGSADGTHFTLPDCRGRIAAGKDDMGGSSANRLTNQTNGLDGDTLGATGGAETHTLTSAQLAAHTHTGTTSSDGSHDHSYNTSSFDKNWPNIAAGVNGGPSTASLTGSSGTHTHTFTTASTGSDAAHNNVQPTIIFNKIIYAGV